MSLTSPVRLVGAVFVAAIVMGGLSKQPAAAHDGDLDHYSAHLRESAALLEEGTNAGDKRASRTLRSIESVILSDGSRFHPNHTEIDTGSSGGARLRALAREVERSIKPAPDATRELKTVLQREEFQDNAAPWYASWIQWLIDAFFAIVGFILAVNAVRWLVGLAAVSLVVLAAVNISRATRTRRASEVELVAALDEDSVPAAKHRDLAREAARAGDYRQAVRRLYLGFLSGLRERGIVKDRDTMTNWEFVRQIESTADPELAKRAELATTLFELKWYGHQDCSRQDYERLKKWCSP